MTNEDSNFTNSGISGDEGHSDPLKVTVEAAARLSTPASVMLRYDGNKRSVLLHVSTIVYKSMPVGETF